MCPSIIILYFCFGERRRESNETMIHGYELKQKAVERTQIQKEWLNTASSSPLSWSFLIRNKKQDERDRMQYCMYVSIFFMQCYLKSITPLLLLFFLNVQPQASSLARSVELSSWKEGKRWDEVKRVWKWCHDWRPEKRKVITRKGMRWDCSSDSGIKRGRMGGDGTFFRSWNGRLVQVTIHSLSLLLFHTNFPSYSLCSIPNPRFWSFTQRDEREAEMMRKSNFEEKKGKTQKVFRVFLFTRNEPRIVFLHPWKELKSSRSLSMSFFPFSILERRNEWNDGKSIRGMNITKLNLDLLLPLFYIFLESNENNILVVLDLTGCSYPSLALHVLFRKNSWESNFERGERKRRTRNVQGLSGFGPKPLVVVEKRAEDGSRETLIPKYSLPLLLCCLCRLITTI